MCLLLVLPYSVHTHTCLLYIALQVVYACMYVCSSCVSVCVHHSQTCAYVLIIPTCVAWFGV